MFLTFNPFRTGTHTQKSDYLIKKTMTFIKKSIIIRIRYCNLSYRVLASSVKFYILHFILWLRVSDSHISALANS